MEMAMLNELALRLSVGAARLLSRREGQGLVEYALIIALVAVLLVGALILLKNQISGTFSSIIGSLTTT